MSRIHVITSGVKDINKSLKFNRDGLSFTITVAEGNPPNKFFQSEGVTLAQCPRESLAEDIDQDNPPEGNGFPGNTLAYITKTKEKVDKILSRAEEAGGEIVKSAQPVLWGGNHGYFSDPDGYYWEVMYWENWKFKDDGSLDIE